MSQLSLFCSTVSGVMRTGWGGGEVMPKAEKFLLQVRLSDAHRRRIKSLAAKQGLTLQQAVVEAFDAWAEKLRRPAHDRRPARPAQPASPAQLPAGLSPASPAREWVELALQLDWAQCPEVELLEAGDLEAIFANPPSEPKPQ